MSNVSLSMASQPFDQLLLVLMRCFAKLVIKYRRKDNTSFSNNQFLCLFFFAEVMFLNPCSKIFKESAKQFGLTLEVEE